MKIFPADFKRKIDYLRGDSTQEQMSNAYRQVNHEIFSFSKIKSTQRHTMNVNALLNVEVAQRQTLRCLIKPGKNHYLALTMIWMKVLSRIYRSGKCESLH